MTANWIREVKLTLYSPFSRVRTSEDSLLANFNNAIDLSEFHFTFETRHSNFGTPDNSLFRIYNLADSTMTQVMEYCTIVLEVGYREQKDSEYDKESPEGEFSPTTKGILFIGDVIQYRRIRENTTDNVLEILAADSYEFYNYIFVNSTLRSVSFETQLDEIIKNDVDKSYIFSPQSFSQLPRGKSYFGLARDYLSEICSSYNSTWTIVDGSLQILPMHGVLPSEAIELSPSTGLIGRANQTLDGIEATCLINPNFKVNTKVKLREQYINDYPYSPDYGFIDLSQRKNIDGYYNVLAINSIGDTRGNDWYMHLTLALIDQSAAPRASIMDRRSFS